MAQQRQYVAVWPSGHYIKWRGLTLSEYRRYARRLDFEPELEVYCDLYDQVVDLSECPQADMATAGIVDFLGRALLKDSPFSQDPNTVNRILDSHRTALRNDYCESCKAIMAGVFRYTFEEIDGWDEATFFARLAAAELLSGEDLGMKPFEEPPQPGSKPGAPRIPKKPLTDTQARALERTMQARRGS